MEFKVSSCAVSKSPESQPSSSPPAPGDLRPADDDRLLDDSEETEDQPRGLVQLLLDDPGARRDLRRYVRRHLQLHHRKNPVPSKSRNRNKKGRPVLLNEKRRVSALRHRWLSRQSRISKHPISDVLLTLKKNRENPGSSASQKKKDGQKTRETAPSSASSQPAKRDRQPTTTSTPPARRPAEWKKLDEWKEILRTELRSIGNSRIRGLPSKYRWAAVTAAVAIGAIGILIGRWDGSEVTQALHAALIQEKTQTETLTRNLEIQGTQLERIRRELKAYAEDTKTLQAKLAQSEKELQRFDAVRGGLTITTVPEGATVKVGGDAVATAPATFQGLIAQTYPVEVELEGYEPVSLQAEVKPQQFTELGNIVLVRSLGSLDLKSDPDGANYELTDRNGEKITGKTPMTLETIPAGRYRLKMSAPLYPTMEQEVVVRKAETEKIFWAFGEGELVVKTEPEGAEITINGEPKGKSPARLKLQAGTHTVSIQFAPWPAQTKTVQVIKDLPTDVSFALTMGKVEITSDKPGTAIWSGDSFLGRTPLQMEIPTAKHDLWAFSQGRMPENQELELGANEAKTAEFHMGKDIDAKIDSKSAPSEQYLAIYLSIQEGEKLATDGKRLEAYKILHVADEKLRRFRKLNPDFEQAIVLNRIRSLQKTMTDLEEGRNPAKRSGPMIKVDSAPQP